MNFVRTETTTKFLPVADIFAKRVGTGYYGIHPSGGIVHCILRSEIKTPADLSQLPELTLDEAHKLIIKHESDTRK